MAWFKKYLSDRQDWIKAVNKTINVAWSECKRRWPNEVLSPPSLLRRRQRKELEELERFMEPEEESEIDDLTRGQHESCVKMKEPLQWWRDNQSPLLCTAALGLVVCRKSDIAAKTTSLHHPKPPTTPFTVDMVWNLLPV